MCCHEESSKYQHPVCKSPYKSVTLSTSRTTTPSADLHYQKDGSLDMWYKSSQEIAKKMGNLNVPALATSSASSRQTKTSDATTKQRQSMEIPPHVPVTSAGLPDLRINAAKDWFQSQARTWNDSEPPVLQQRDDYYAGRLMDGMFQRIVEMQRVYEPEQLYVLCMHLYTHSHCVKELSRAQRVGFRL